MWRSEVVLDAVEQLRGDLPVDNALVAAERDGHDLLGLQAWWQAGCAPGGGRHQLVEDIGGRGGGGFRSDRCLDEGVKSLGLAEPHQLVQGVAGRGGQEHVVGSADGQDASLRGVDDGGEVLDPKHA